MNLSLLNSLCYTAGWFWCVLFGIHGQSILAIIGAIFLIVLQLYCAKIKEISLYIQDLLLVIFSIFSGFFLETLFIQTTIIEYINSSKNFPPIWIVCIYPLFVLQLNHSLKTFKKNYLLLFVLVFFGAPFNYMGGVHLGALIFPHPLNLSFIMIGICWGLYLCLITKIANIFEKATLETLEDRDSNNHLELLYDGECPICKKEICMLQKKQIRGKIKFTDIASKNFRSSGYKNIDYPTAMSQIHAIDSKGNVLIGVAAFAAVYARSELLITSTLLRIPFIEFFLKPLYKLFAKNRLWMTGRKKSEDTLKKKQVWISFIIFIVLCFIVQIIGSFWTRETISTWYPTLIKPSWTPPNSIFGPVWSCLYVVIAVAGWLIYRTESSSQRSLALIFYGVQLSLNFIWSFLFFSLRNPMLGLIDILLLSLFIILTIIKTYSFRPLASLLLIPYLLWVLYATGLNAAIYILNK